MFNFYYKSDFAKKSAITEDSALAGAFKIAGTAVGYLYSGGVLKGMAASAGLGGTTLGKTALKVASSSTWGTTSAAAIGGLGAGTEVGLYKGKNINEALTHEGLKTAGVQGALAFVGGKAGEGMAKRAAVKEATEAFKSADEAVSSASDRLAKGLSNSDDIINTTANGGLGESAADVYSKAVSARNVASENLKNISNTKWSSFQGYTDSVTKAGERFGAAEMDLLKAGGQYIGNSTKAAVLGRKGIEHAAEHEAASAAATKAADAFKSSGKTLLRENPVSQVLSKPVGNISSSLKNLSEKDYTIPTKETVPIGETIKDMGAKTLSGVKAAATSPKTPGIAATKIYSAINTAQDKKAQDQFDTNDVAIKTIKDITPPQPSYVDEYPTLPEQATITSGNGSNNDASNGNGSNNYASNGNNNSSSNSNIGYANNNTSQDSNTQFKHNEETTSNSTTPSGGTSTGGNNSSGTTTGGGTSTGGNSSSGTSTGGNNSSGTTTGGNNSSGTSTGGNNSSGTTTGGNIITPPSSNSNSSSGGQHSGGGYSSTGGYKASHGGGVSSYENGDYAGDETDLSVKENIDIATKEAKTSIDEIIKGNKYTKIPTATTPITTKKSGGGSSVIPIAAGLSAAAAAGIGAKAYMDKKKNSEEDYDDEDVEEWSEEDTLDLTDESDDYESYNDPEEEYLSEDDEFGYQTEEVEKYGARTNDELADVQ